VLAAEVVSKGALTLEGNIQGPLDISGVVFAPKYVAIVSDETSVLQTLGRTDTDKYRVESTLKLLEGNGEIDLEGVASDGQFLYAIGSHSLRRKKIDLERSRKKNRERLEEADHDSDRDHVFRVEVDANGELGASEEVGLRPILKDDPTLGPFTHVPCKENGLDIEGIAVYDGQVYCGLRGPVLHRDFAVVMVFDFDDPGKYKLRFIDLGGLGVRDITRASDAFLIVAGPVTDGRGNYEIFAWDGSDGVPGNDVTVVSPKKLGQIPVPDGAKAEGIAVMNETTTHYEVVVVYDGAANGGPTKLSVSK
jgi:hypothetical protein